MDTNGHKVNGEGLRSCTIGARIKEERLRLKLSQALFAERVGVHRRTQINYEKDERKPDTDYLQALARSGVDVGYVLTGTPGQAQMQVYASALDIIKVELGLFKGDFRQEWDAALSAVTEDWRAWRAGNPGANLGDAAIRGILRKSPRLLPDVDTLQDVIEKLEFVLASRQITLTASGKADAVMKLLRFVKEEGPRAVSLSRIDEVLSSVQ